MPDLFTAGGMSAAISIVEALKKTKGDTDVDTLIKKMEGMEFDTPKGKMKFREKDHQAMQTLYSITLKSKMVLIIRCQYYIREDTVQNK